MPCEDLRVSSSLNKEVPLGLHSYKLETLNSELPSVSVQEEAF